MTTLCLYESLGEPKTYLLSSAGEIHDYRPIATIRGYVTGTQPHHHQIAVDQPKPGDRYKIDNDYFEVVDVDWLRLPQHTKYNDENTNGN